VEPYLERRQGRKKEKAATYLKHSERGYVEKRILEKKGITLPKMQEGKRHPCTQKR